ncbi:putative SKG6 domain protein [Rhizoctonia solani 123E]|uniref:Putative SKG6 domain protein n=1 Tax=Rhizoctonia solani 123E TaxID=1423351 RepID=A0A074S4H2_9AGAM|nr:putative SKG6 domain protein [Rhizoctonia solani 123E]
MPFYNVTVDDVAAIFEYYIPAPRPWTDSPTSDQQLHYYWDSTYHSSNIFGAQASIRFQGTAVYLFAAKRGKHGPYEIVLDGQKVFDGNSYSPTPLYNEIMYNATGLTPDWHNLTIRNSDPSNQTYTEVDFIRWTTLMPESLAETTGTIIPYSQNSYSSKNAWTENTEGSNPSMITTTDGASVNITFNGNGIELYGKTGPAYGTFSAQVEGYDAHELNANSEQVHDTLLFRQDNLTSGQHTMLVTNRGTTTLAITSAKPVLWRDPSSAGSDGQSGTHSTSTALIAGVVVGAVVGLAALVIIIIFGLRRHRRKRRDNDNRVHSSHEPAFLDATPFELPASSNEHTTYVQSPASGRPTKFRSEGSQFGSYPLQYQAVLGSPGMSSRGSFDIPQGANLGVPGSSAGGSSSRPNSSGKHQRSSEPTSRNEIPEGVQVIQDSDAGPILLPPAYSAAMEARAPVELPGSFAPSVSSFATPVAHTPVSATPVPTSSSPALPPGAASPVMPNSNLGR